MQITNSCETKQVKFTEEKVEFLGVDKINPKQILTLEYLMCCGKRGNFSRTMRESIIFLTRESENNSADFCGIFYEVKIYRRNV